MNRSKVINAYEEAVDKKSKEKELKIIFNKLGLNSHVYTADDVLENLVTLLVAKGLISLKDFENETK